MDVILVSGIYDYIPARSLGVYLLRHYLNKRGYSCQIIDHCQEFSGEKLFMMISKFVVSNTVCVGFSTTFWRDPEKRIWKNDQGLPPNIYEVTKLLKQKYPGIKIILGGAGLRNVGSNTEHVDHVVVGESEDTLPELLDYWTKNASEPKNRLNLVTGKKYYIGPNIKTHDISTCDFQWIDNDCIMPGEALPLETARGCIFKCRFCSYPHLGKKKFDYIKPIDLIRNHLIRNYEKWGVTKYTIIDDTFNDSELKIDDFLSMSKSLPFELNYVAYIRVDLVHRFTGMAEKLYDSGLRACFFGIESLHPKGSLSVGKGWSGKYAREYVPHLINNIWQNKVNVTTGFIAGLPGEDKDSLLDTLKWVNDNDITTFWLGLGISSPNTLIDRSLEDSGFTSEFERNSAIYGYRFDSNGEWYNGIWNKKSAEEFANNILNPNRKNKKISCWVHIQLGSLGLDTNEINNIANSGKRHIHVIMDKTIQEKKQNFIDEYEKRIMSL